MRARNPINIPGTRGYHHSPEMGWFGLLTTTTVITNELFDKIVLPLSYNSDCHLVDHEYKYIKELI